MVNQKLIRSHFKSSHAEGFSVPWKSTFISKQSWFFPMNHEKSDEDEVFLL